MSGSTSIFTYDSVVHLLEVAVLAWLFALIAALLLLTCSMLYRIVHVMYATEVSRDPTYAREALPGPEPAAF
jgi:hypothetical protein